MNRIQRWIKAHPRIHVLLLTLYYVGIICTLLLLYSRRDFKTPEFIYQEF